MRNKGYSDYGMERATTDAGESTDQVAPVFWHNVLVNPAAAKNL
jgi:hypothetical protein